MTKRDDEGQSDSGITAEDLSQLMEHIELTTERRLVGGHEWELARSADDLEDAPVFVDEDTRLMQGLEVQDASEDIELFTETEVDLNQRLSEAEDEQLELAAGIGAERARWQKRVSSLSADMAERNRLLAEREQEIEDLSAQLARLAVERDGFLEELRDLQRSVGHDEVLEDPDAPTPAESVFAGLNERLSKRGRALRDAREEIDRLRAAREQLLADLAEREEFIQNLRNHLRELDGGSQGGDELRRLLRRFFGGEQKAEAAPAIQDPMEAPPELRAEESVELPAALTMEVPIVDMADLEPPVIEDMAPPVAAQADQRVRRYLIGLDSVGSVYEVTLPRINIGRTRDNDLRIVDPTVSRLHAVLKVRGREVSVIDANSRNGVFINGIQLRYGKLDDGDTLTFGAVRFRYRVGSGSTGGEYGPT
ncbi:MAG: FHA domain-containing protein [Steroidobacteraceae bacterium]